MAGKRRKIYCAFTGIKGGAMIFIPREQYAKIIDVLPILCVDIMVQNSKDEYLLVKRANEPLKGQWWVIGGRVLKGETLEEAAIRKVKEEVGLDISSVKPIGYYEEISHTNHFNSLTPLHSMSVVFSTTVDGAQKVKLDNQSSDWKYSQELPKGLGIKPF